jgi:hypothetical protein
MRTTPSQPSTKRSRAHAVQGYLAHIRNSGPLGPYSRTMPRALWWSQGGGHQDKRVLNEVNTLSTIHQLK